MCFSFTASLVWLVLLSSCRWFLSCHTGFRLILHFNPHLQHWNSLEFREHLEGEMLFSAAEMRAAPQVLLSSSLTFLLINVCLCGCQSNETHSHLFSLAVIVCVCVFFGVFFLLFCLTVLLPMCETRFFCHCIDTAASLFGPHPPGQANGSCWHREL